MCVQVNKKGFVCVGAVVLNKRWAGFWSLRRGLFESELLLQAPHYHGVCLCPPLWIFSAKPGQAGLVTYTVLFKGQQASGLYWWTEQSVSDIGYRPIYF